jgi:hypothetical protein
LAVLCFSDFISLSPSWCHCFRLFFPLWVFSSSFISLCLFSFLIVISLSLSFAILFQSFFLPMTACMDAAPTRSISNAYRHFVTTAAREVPRLHRPRRERVDFVRFIKCKSHQTKSIGGDQ